MARNSWIALLLAAATARGINLRAASADTVGIALDETVTRIDIAALIPAGRLWGAEGAAAMLFGESSTTMQFAGSTPSARAAATRPAARSTPRSTAGAPTPPRGDGR